MNRMCCMLVVLGTLAGLLSCDKGELTRGELSLGKAKSIIDSSPKFTPATGLDVAVPKPARECGLANGWWTGGTDGISITEKGKEFFNRAWLGSAELRGQHQRKVINITAITDPPKPEAGGSSSTKIAQLNWQWSWDKVPAEVQKCFGNQPPPPRNERAVLQLYDDGWRFERLMR
jgi:hypothetical protein